MSIGDVNGTTAGSGARYNDGKVAYDLLPLALVLDHIIKYPRASAMDENECAQEIINLLSQWQAGDDRALDYALMHSRDLAAPTALSEFAPACRVFAYGKKKYAAWNWAKGMDWSVPAGCAIRHCDAILSGERLDPESGEPHMGHVQCNLLMLAQYRKTYLAGDDRPVKWLFPENDTPFGDVFINPEEILHPIPYRPLTRNQYGKVTFGGPVTTRSA